MATDPLEQTQILKIDLYETDERYEFKLSDILRKRHRPLLMIMNEDGDLLFSSLEPDAPEPERDLLDAAYGQASLLCRGEARMSGAVEQVVVDKPGERCALVMLDDKLYSLRLFAMHRGQVRRGQPRLFAALAEPIVKPGAAGLDLSRVRDAYRLTNRELDVIESLVAGHTDKEIAISLDVSAETVRAYMKSVRGKLGVSTRTGIVHLVYELSQHGSSSRA